MTLSVTSTHLAHLNAATKLPAFAKLAVRVAYVLTRWTQTARTRHALKQLDDHLLNDIGLSYRQAHREFRRPFWIG